LDATNDIGKYSSFKARGEITWFEGETLYYDISFLWFDNAASAKVRFLKKEVGIIQLWKPAPKGLSDFSLLTVNITIKLNLKSLMMGKAFVPYPFFVKSI
jgi:hypothetical protein